VKKNLSLMIAQDRLQSYAGPAQRILASADIVVNDEQIEEASYSSYEGTDGEKFFTLNFSLTDEGRKRLWKYSRGRIGNQLLVVKDGIAIAAPKIRHELSDSNVDVTQLQEETLVKETVDLVRQLREGSKN
jgi:preprotein translocase subunit SecD